MFILKKKKKSVHIYLEKPFTSYYYYDEIIDFVNGFWQRKKYLFAGYYFIHPVLNEGQRWKHDYIIVAKNKRLKAKWTRQDPNAHHLMLRDHSTS